VLGFSLSPYPAVPWKQDWTTNAGRMQSIRSYPLFEQGMSVYIWRDCAFGFEDDSTATKHPGTDYVHAYWLARKVAALKAGE
jgi:hypothetical protein